MTDPSPLPLDGIRILDLSIALTGPYAVALLADQGAEVIKIERPGIGDIGRYVGVSVNGMSALFQSCNRGKRSLAIDPHTADGRVIVHRLARDADLVVQNFRPGVVERLGIAYNDLRRVNQRLVYVSLTGFGPEGPYAHKGAYDTVIQAYGGLASNQADPETGEPRFINQTVADKVTALYAAQAMTAALFARERTGRGAHVQLSMLDAVVSFLWADAAGNEVLRDADHSQPSSFVQNFRPLRFLDGWGICTPTSDANFAGMCRAFDVDGYDDPRVATIVERGRNREFTGKLLEQCYAAAAQMTTAEAIGRMEIEEVPCGVVIAPRTSRPTTRTCKPSACSSTRCTRPRDDCANRAIPRSSTRPVRRSAIPHRRSASTPTRSSPTSATATASRRSAPAASSADASDFTREEVSDGDLRVAGVEQRQEREQLAEVARHLHPAAHETDRERKIAVAQCLRVRRRGRERHVGRGRWRPVAVFDRPCDRRRAPTSGRLPSCPRRRRTRRFTRVHARGCLRTGRPRTRRRAPVRRRANERACTPPTGTSRARRRRGGGTRIPSGSTCVRCASSASRRLCRKSPTSMRVVKSSVRSLSKPRSNHCAKALSMPRARYASCNALTRAIDHDTR